MLVRYVLIVSGLLKCCLLFSSERVSVLDRTVRGKGSREVSVLVSDEDTFFAVKQALAPVVGVLADKQLLVLHSRGVFKSQQSLPQPPVVSRILPDATQIGDRRSFIMTTASQQSSARPPVATLAELVIQMRVRESEV